MSLAANVNLLRALSPSAVAVRPRRDWALWTALGTIALIAFLCLAAPILPLQNPTTNNVLAVAQAPSWHHLFGTDDLGRDMLARVVYGGRPPILIGVISVLISLMIGVIFGTVAAYRSGIVDQILGRLADIQLSIPGLVLSLVVLAVYGTSPVNITIVIGIEAWPLYFRVVRAQALQAREAAFVEAARLAGLRGVRILFHHILPSTYGVLLVAVAINFTGAVLTESALGFLGTGIQPPTPDWGASIAEGQSYLSNAWWIALFPGLFLAILLLAFQTVGDSLSTRYTLKDVTLGGVADVAGNR